MKRLTKTFISVVAAFIFATMLAVPAWAAAQPGDILDGVDATTYPDQIKAAFPEVAAPRWALVDEDGMLLAGHNAYEPAKIASTTKVMTGIIACDWPLNTQVPVSAFAASIPGSSAYVQEGDIITLGELLEGLMLPSGNDAAYAIAECLGGLLLQQEGNPAHAAADPAPKVERFVKEMNDRAVQIGCKDTLFTNPCGLDDEGFEGDHHSCAYDVALMSRAASNCPALAAVADMSKSEMDVLRAGQPEKVILENTNGLLDIRVEEATGMKTGFTDQAGSCLSGSCQIDGDRYFSAVLGCEERYDTFVATAVLWDWARASKVDTECIEGFEKQPDGSLLVATLAQTEWCDKTFDAVIPANQTDHVCSRWNWEDMPTSSLEITYESGAVKKGDVVGKFTVTECNGTEHTVDVVAAETVKSPGWWDSVVIFFTRLFSPLTGAQTQETDATYEERWRSTDIGLHYSPQTVPVPSQPQTL